MTDNASEHSDQWTQKILSNLANDYLKEKKRKRHWSVFFKLIFLVLFIFVIWKAWSSEKPTVVADAPHVALIDIQGVISDDHYGGNADDIAKGLRSAYDNKKVKGIILRINSPGGSAVQADYVFNEILRLRALYPEIPVYTVCTDVCASAAYYIASASDEIYANPSSLVGSIGVLFNGFGFTGTMDKLGIDRRLLTSGQYKGFMDPFSPVNPIEEEHLQQLIDGVFEKFKQSVLQGRGDRLQDSQEIFSGLFWNGADAKQLGLIDGFGSAGFVARDILETEVIVNYTVQPNYFSRLARELGLNIGSRIASQIGLQPSGLQ
ncbi:MAG: S49 family peptidase [Legionellales bacterium]|nr:S49 family peptidase [Legionellales bacterium]